MPLPMRKDLTFDEWRVARRGVVVITGGLADEGVDVAKACRIIFNRSTCAGIGLCEMHAPEYFEIPDDGDGLMTPRTLTVDADHREMAEDAASSCPTASISIVDL